MEAQNSRKVQNAVVKDQSEIELILKKTQEENKKFQEELKRLPFPSTLSQEQDGQEKVIAYARKLLTPAEQSYCAIRRELLAVILLPQIFLTISVRLQIHHSDRSCSS